MAKHYSRFASNEEQRSKKRAVRFIFLTATSLVLIYFFGLPLVVKFAAFLTDVRKSTTPIEKSDTTPPAPPQFKNLPEATNTSVLTIEGTSESGAMVSIFFNNEKSEVVANEEGLFAKKLTLLNGENILSAQAKDTQGNEGLKTQEYKIAFDNEPPSLEIINPGDGAQVSGSQNQKTTITGKTDPEASLTINDRFVSVSEAGEFSFSLTLSEGDNVFNIKAEDRAGNLSEKSITIKYSP